MSNEPDTDWDRGGRAMLTCTIAGLECVERGIWTLSKYRQWLEALRKKDPAFVKKAKAMVVTKLKQGTN